MKKIKKFESFNEGIEKITNYINRLLKRGGDFANDVWDATKRESQETKLALEILRRMLKGEEVSDKEKEFVITANLRTPELPSSYSNALNKLQSMTENTQY